ncbi:MAG TPA: DHHA1 domain-containing protein, partial [Tepidisphaeraceae bacterium]|nr:DHHA1 domain-containing protein [Tepidisphaeraceae bacterium]
TAVVDHHLSHGRRLQCPFCDLRTDVGATASIVFSYFMELNVPIPPDLAAVLLFAIETDLAGAAGTPGDLDNVALSSLTLMADARKLYQMRYVDLPQTFFIAFAQGLEAAVVYDSAVVAHLDTIDSVEKAAILADLFLRYESAKWSMVTARFENKLIVSIRRREGKLTAAQMARRILRGIGEGGGHRNKAGGAIVLQTNTPAELDRFRKQLRRRFLRLLGIEVGRGQKLVPEAKKVNHGDTEGIETNV